MPDRMLVTERQQVGIELTPGTAAVPTINLQALSIDIDTNLEFDEFGPMGQLPQSIVAPRQEWSAGSLSGYPTYTELPYALSNALGAAVITTPSGATLARQWLWEPSASTPWVPKTWTLRRGVPGDTAEEANYLLMGGIESVLKAALEYTHKPESWLPGLKWIVSHESGGDAGAKNPHSTASGLFQLIDSTWAAYRDKNLPNDVFNPMANAVAGINYIDQRYGNPDKAVDFWKANNYYGDGGIAWSPQIAHLAEKGPEAVIPLGQLGGIGGASTTIQIVVQGSLVAQQELETVVADAWRRAARSGRL